MGQELPLLVERFCLKRSDSLYGTQSNGKEILFLGESLAVAKTSATLFNKEANKVINVNLWDTSGITFHQLGCIDQRFDALVCVFSYLDKETLIAAESKWIPKARECFGASVPLGSDLLFPLFLFVALILVKCSLLWTKRNEPLLRNLKANNAFQTNKQNK